MGSTGSRKPSDTVRIKPVQQSKPTSAGTGISGGEGGNTPDINNLCPIRFRVKLTRQDIVAGLNLTLDDNILSAVGIGEVGKISSGVIKRLQTCLGMGIHYSIITTVVDQGACYAEFTQ